MKLNKTYTTETTIADQGYYRLTQYDNHVMEKAVILLSPCQMEALIEDMKNYLAAKDDWWNANYGEET